MARTITRSTLVGLACLAVCLASVRSAKAQVTLRLGDEPGFASWQEPIADPPTDSCDGCDVSNGLGCACPAPATWARAEYLLWWMKGNHLPALLTTSPPATPLADAGVLGAAGTQVLFGDAQIDNEYRSGLRISVGHWLDDCQELGLEAVYFSVFDDTGTGDYRAMTTGGASSGSPILARPFFDVILGQENARLISYPNLVDGDISISSSSEMHSASVLLRRKLHSGCRGRIDLIGGYRYFRLREGLLIDEHLTSTLVGGLVPPGTTYDIYDSFVAENDFHGGDLGVVATFLQGPLNVELLAKVALGNIHRTVTIEGGTRQTTPPPVTVTEEVGGLLALSSNVGQRTDNDFAALPEFGVNLSYECTDNVTLLFGYTLLMLTDVTRTGEQIDRNVNPTLFPGQAPAPPPAPVSQFNSVTDFWAHGMTAGVMVEL